MTKIQYQINKGYYEEIIVSGHANFANLGKDIVCASISSILITTINAIVRLDNESIEYSESNARLYIKVINKNEITNLLLINMMELLSDLESQYPKNVKIRKMV